MMASFFSKNIFPLLQVGSTAYLLDRFLFIQHFFCCRLAAQAAAQQAVQAQQAVAQTQHYVAQQPLQVRTLLLFSNF